VSPGLGSAQGQLRAGGGVLPGRDRCVPVSACLAQGRGGEEKSAHVICQRWWRSLGDEVTLTEAQQRLDRVCAKLDGRTRKQDGVVITVGALAEAEALRPAPAPLPAMLQVERTVTNQALVAFRGNRYSGPTRIRRATGERAPPIGQRHAGHRHRPRRMTGASPPRPGWRWGAGPPR
jgi:hypothetical protein